LARAREIGERLGRSLRALQARYSTAIADVRGLGAMMGMEFASEGHGESAAQAILEEARSRGLLLILAGKRNVIRMLVPLVIADDELDDALAILEASTDAVLGAQRS
jgi:4-aminobutyrate aminotransferase/(S)-3-amino-2-methylpropionate transaminase